MEHGAVTERGKPADLIDSPSHPRLQGFVKGATAAAAGAIGGATIVLTRSAVVDYRTALIAFVALVLLWRFKLREPYIVGLAALAGIALR